MKLGTGGWLAAYLFRWFGHAAPAGLYQSGNPDSHSPVLVTCNFSLTVKRLLKAVEGLDLWVLAANSEGINVWCAAVGKTFTHNRVIDAVKISGLADKVRHRDLILPQLSAAGMDLKVIKEETGFRARFGPVEAADIPAYLLAGEKKTEEMCRSRFDFRHRADMFLSMNFPIYLVIAVVLGIFFREYLWGFTALFWGAAAVLYAGINVIPGRTGWGKAVFAWAVLVAGWAGFDWFMYHDPCLHGGWLIAAFGIFLAAGLDLAGTASGRKSDPMTLVQSLGLSSVPGLIKETDTGSLVFERDACRGCGTCREVCPLGVFGDLDEDKKTTFRDRSACFACSACVMQCPRGALRLSR
jgi:NAD-dependent dihydropyrimidine dehydrogenase PreA subunit